MRKFILCLMLLVLIFTVIVYGNSTVTDVNEVTADKNWLYPLYDSWADITAREIGEPGQKIGKEKAPQNMAPSTIGIKSLSTNASYDYKQSLISLKNQADRFYVNSFKEIFSPLGSQLLHDIVIGDVPLNHTETGNFAMDNYVPDLYYGLNEEELKWLLNNNIISRNITTITVGTNEVSFNPDPSKRYEAGGLSPLVDLSIDEWMKKSDFVVALHKATYGVIESRPIVFDIDPYRYSYKVTWAWSWPCGRPDPEFVMNIGQEELTNTLLAGNKGRKRVEEEQLEWFSGDIFLDRAEYNMVNDRTWNSFLGKNTGSTLQYAKRHCDDPMCGTNWYGTLDRGEYVTRMEGDTQFVVTSFPDKDKLFITSPNVTELYIKSLIDKGHISSRNLTHVADSKNQITDVGNIRNFLQTSFATYGKIDDTKKQHYPMFAPELGALEKNRSHTYFQASIISGTENYPWGKRYIINASNNTIQYNPTFDYFVYEHMLTIDALQLIESILRVREGDMTDTEAQLVSYKYGVNYIDTLQGRDRSTVMYLTAKGILNFENFEEYTYLYSRLDLKFAYTLLYRVANPAARKNFSEVQLTDSDNFWIGKGYGSYNLSVNVPNYGTLSSYTDDSGKVTADPIRTNNEHQANKNILRPMPYVETGKVAVLGQELARPFREANRATERINEIQGFASNFPITQLMVSEYNKLLPIVNHNHNSESEILYTDFTYIAGGIEVNHPQGYDIYESLGTDLYEGENFLKVLEDSQSIVQLSNGASPFGNPSAPAVDDREPDIYIVEKLFDDPWKYIYDKDPIIQLKEGDLANIPVTIQERIDSKDNIEVHDSQVAPTKQPQVIYSIEYFPEFDKYKVTFFVEATSFNAAMILVDSKIEMTADALNNNFNVNVTSKVSTNGKHVIMIDKDSLARLDPDIIIISDNVLLNRRTGTRAILLQEQNLALVGNHIIETDADTLMVEARDSVLYYNLDVISTLISNSALSTIGEKEFYSLASIQAEDYKPVYSSGGDKIATAITGEFKHQIEGTQDDDTGETSPIDVLREYVNLSQLTSGSNTLIKKFRREVPDMQGGSVPIDFSVIVEWNLVLPGSHHDLMQFPVDVAVNPTTKEINEFYYTRPTDEWKDLQEFWDNNIEISNAIANVMYGSTGIKYIECGYLVPNLSLLFEFDDNETNNGEDVRSRVKVGEIYTLVYGDTMFERGQMLRVVMGEWFQEVGLEMNMDWVNLFFGESILYNKILHNNENETNHPDHISNYLDLVIMLDEKGEETDDPNKCTQYMIRSNEGNVYFNQVKIPLSYFPAWFHTSYNNNFRYGSGWDATIAKNGAMWRELSGERSFGFYARKERKSYGTVYGNSGADDITWIILPSGAIYKSIIAGSGYTRLGDGIQVETRNTAVDYGRLVGKTVTFDNKFYYVSRFDDQYLELISLESMTGYARNGQFYIEQQPLFETAHGTVRAVFSGRENDANYIWRNNSVEEYKLLNNSLPMTFYEQNIPYVITDSSGGLVVKYVTTTSIGGQHIPKFTDLKQSQYNHKIVRYHPVVRLSILGWGVENTSSEVPELRPRRTLPVLLVENMFLSSLSRTTIDAMIQKEVNTININDLPEGGVVLIGDMYLYKTGNGFVTAPIRILSTRAMPTISNGLLSSTDLQKLALNMLNMPVNSGGKAETIASFINSVELAPKISHEKFMYAKTIVAYGRNSLEPYLVTNDDLPKLMTIGDVPNSISLYLEFDSGIQCIAVSESEMLYTTLFAVDRSGSSTFTDLPIFGKSAEYLVRNKIDLESFSMNFQPLPNQFAIKEQFMDEHSAQIKKDTIYWIKSVLCLILAYLMIVCVLFFFMLQNHVVYRILTQIKNRPGGGKGIDIVAVMTFGVLSVDHDTTGVRLTISVIMLMIAFALLMNLDNWTELFMSRFSTYR